MRAISRNERFSSSFANGTIKFKYNYVTVENFKPSNLLNLSGNSPQIYEFCQPVCEKKLRIFCFQKTLWLDNLLPSIPVWVSALLRASTKSRDETGKKLLKTPQRSKPQNHDYYVQNIRKNMKHGSSKRDIRIEIKVPTCVLVIIAIKYWNWVERSPLSETLVKQNHNDKPVRVIRISRVDIVQ